MELGVYCECDQRLPVTESDAGSSIQCSCGRNVVVPLLDEFRVRPVLLSAVSLERRVQRLIAERELPITDACAGCGEGEGVQAVNVELECERSWAITSGGPRFLITPWFWVAWEEEKRTEVPGRDTVIRAPIGVCPECRQRFRRPNRLVYLMVAVALLGAGLVLAYVHVLIRIGSMAVALAALYWQSRRAWKRRQRAIKDLLRNVPVYRQLLAQYPYATVIVREEGVAGQQ
jgi:hypothetical protein